MKKLMIAAFAVAFASATQAAQINWTSNNMSLTDDKGNPVATQLDGYTLVLVNLGSTIDWDNATVIPTGSGSDQTTITINTSTTSKRGRVTGKVGVTYNAADTSSNIVNNGDYLALMFQDGEGNLSKLTYTATGAEVGDEAVVLINGLVNNSSSITAANGTIGLTGNFTAVPEPTSAMLVLLGVAGLALRRRRA